jgi:PTS system nitrogen regulatory IIA component
VAYVRPVSPISLDAPDGQAVNNIAVLLVPGWADSTHLHLLADVAQRFCNHHVREEPELRQVRQQRALNFSV